MLLFKNYFVLNKISLCIKQRFQNGDHLKTRFNSIFGTDQCMHEETYNLLLGISWVTNVRPDNHTDTFASVKKSKLVSFHLSK